MTPDEISRGIVDDFKESATRNWLVLVSAIASAITAERERAEKAEREREAIREMWIDSVDQRETWGIAAAEERIRAEAAEAERDRLRDAASALEGLLTAYKGHGTGQPPTFGLPQIADKVRAAYAALRKMAVDPRCDEIGTGGEPKGVKG
jgi:hypothetical protein